MTADPNPELKPIIRNPWLYSSLLFLVALLYVGWIFFSRWQQNRDFEQKAATQKRAEDQRAVDALGGNRFDILNFYGPATVRQGEQAQLCYGVSNAKTVRLDPPATAAVWPSYSRCVDAAPTQDTTYTLTAEDAAGHTKTATLTVQVR
jgi:hypothetical protein